MFTPISASRLEAKASSDGLSTEPTHQTAGSQCLNCGCTKVPDRQCIRCDKCGGFELHLFPVGENQGSPDSQPS